MAVSATTLLVSTLTLKKASATAHRVSEDSALNGSSSLIFSQSHSFCSRDVHWSSDVPHFWNVTNENSEDPFRLFPRMGRWPFVENLLSFDAVSANSDWCTTLVAPFTDRQFPMLVESDRFAKKRERSLACCYLAPLLRLDTYLQNECHMHRSLTG